MTVWLAPAPAALLARTRALLTEGQAGPAIADLLPAGLTPGRGWPAPGDLIGLAISEPAYLIVVDGQVVGGCGRKQRTAPDDAQPEIGYGLSPAWQHRGIGTEAVRQLLVALAQLGANSVTAQVLPTNTASLRLLDRLGFTEYDGSDADHVWLSRSLTVTTS